MLDNVKQTSFQETPTKAPGENHLACVLLLDSSSSMRGDPIASLNAGIRRFLEETCKDELTRERVDLAIIEFNSAPHMVQDFAPISQVKPVTLTAQGNTAMNQGINMAIDRVKARTNFYAVQGTPCYRPWIVMITDGEPTEDISLARQRIIEEEAKGEYGHLKFFAFGVPGYDKNTLLSLTKRAVALKDASFEGFFDWLKDSMILQSGSNLDDNIQFPPLPEGASILKRETPDKDW